MTSVDNSIDKRGPSTCEGVIPKGGAMSIEIYFRAVLIFTVLARALNAEGDSVNWVTRTSPSTFPYSWTINIIALGRPVTNIPGRLQLTSKTNPTSIIYQHRAQNPIPKLYKFGRRTFRTFHSHGTNRKTSRIHVPRHLFSPDPSGDLSTPTGTHGKTGVLHRLLRGVGVQTRLLRLNASYHLRRLATLLSILIWYLREMSSDICAIYGSNSYLSRIQREASDDDYRWLEAFEGILGGCTRAGVLRDQLMRIFHRFKGYKR